MDKLCEFTEKLILGLVKNKEIVKIQDFEDEEGNPILEIIVSNEDMARVIGKSGNNIKALKNLINACAYKNNLNKVKVNVDSV